MMRLGCVKIQILLERKRSGISEPDRLLLEEHLAGCDRCARDARDLDRLIALADSTLKERPSSSARAIDWALATPATPALGPRRAGFSFAAAGALVSLAGILLFFALRREDDPTPKSELIATADGPIATPEEQPQVDGAGEPSRARQLAHARVHLSLDAEIRWDGAEITLHLLKGSIDVDVDPGPRRAFRVETEKFRILTLGARFNADTHGVHVGEGEVKVNGADVLRAGERWPKKGQPRARSRSSRPEPDRRASLEAARRDLVEGRIEKARAQIRAVLESGPARPEEAEALTLLAECASVGGDEKEAVRHYQDAAFRFSDLPAGENALFAAARLSEGAESRRLLELYLARYRGGRFHREVLRRLEAMRARKEP